MSRPKVPTGRPTRRSDSPTEFEAAFRADKAAKPKAPVLPSRAPAEGVEPGHLTPLVGRNLKRLRTERAMSLEVLARASGVSRAMLGQIELGQSTPTINVVWKIARAFDVPFSALIGEETTDGTWVLPKKKSKVLLSSEGVMRSRALFPMDRPRSVEFYELSLAPLADEKADAHARGTQENLVVTSGRIVLSIGDDRRVLEVGDAAFFAADVPHGYQNLSSEEDAVLYLVMTYAQDRTHVGGG